MSFGLHHLHIKSPDPEQTAKFYVDNLGAELLGDLMGIGVRLNLHGLTIFLSTYVEEQQREQHYGIEHIALETDDIESAVNDLSASGAKVLETKTTNTGRKICFVEGPDGVQFELLETAG